MLLHGPAATIMCAHANNEPFLLMAGAGFDGRVIAALDHRFKSYVGKAAYAGPVLGALVRPIDVLTVTVDGSRHEASWAVIANARHYGGRLRPGAAHGHPGARPAGRAVQGQEPGRADRAASEPGHGAARYARRQPSATSRCCPAPPQRLPRTIRCRLRSMAMRSAPPRSRSRPARRSCDLSCPIELTF